MTGGTKSASASQTRRRRVMASPMPPSTSRVAAPPTGNAQSETSPLVATLAGCEAGCACGTGSTGAIDAGCAASGAGARPVDGAAATGAAALAVRVARGAVVAVRGARARSGAIVSATAGAATAAAGAASGMTIVGATGGGVAGAAATGAVGTVICTASCARAIPVESINMAEAAMMVRGDMLRLLFMQSKRGEAFFSHTKAMSRAVIVDELTIRRYFAYDYRVFLLTVNRADRFRLHLRAALSAKSPTWSLTWPLPNPICGPCPRFEQGRPMRRGRPRKEAPGNPSDAKGCGPWSSVIGASCAVRPFIV